MVYANPDANNPGPVDSSVLYEQERHVSSAIWEGQERGVLRCHEHTSKLDQWILTTKQIELVERAGFGHFRLIPSISIENTLVSALVERWRRETNTFHLTVGEMTVTLTDVALLLGLAIEGEPVIGVTYTSCGSVCERFLGRAPGPGCSSGGMVKLCWLKDNFSQCPENAPIEVIEWHTRAYLLYLIGSTIFCTTTGNKVPVMYLPLFENFDNAGNYAWGAAALAFLYRALGNASLRTQGTISGSLTLLQCWSYFHLNIGRPKLDRNPMQDCFPYALRWNGKQSGPTSNRDVVYYRKALDALKPCDVEWLPYKHLDGTVIPESINYYLYLGRSRTMLICFDKAERHLPDRCLRQYAMLQPIPEDVERWERKNRGVDGGIDWSGKMESELNEWYDRKYHIVNDDDSVEESEYMQWYFNITRKFVGRPISLSFEFQRVNSILREIAHIADTFPEKGLDEEQINAITQIRYLAHDSSRDQVQEAYAVAATSPTNFKKRIRGKNKSRSNEMRKRKRKDNLLQCHVGTEGDKSHFYATSVVVDQLQLRDEDSEVDQMCHETAEAVSMDLVNTTDNINDERIYDVTSGVDGSKFADLSNDVNNYQFSGSVVNTSELCNVNISDTHTCQTSVDDSEFPSAYVSNPLGVAHVNDFQLDNVHVVDSNQDYALEKQGDEIQIGDSQPSNAKSCDDNISDTHTYQTRVDDSQFPSAYVNNKHGVAHVNDFQLDNNVHVINSNPEQALEKQGDEIHIGDSETDFARLWNDNIGNTHTCQTCVDDSQFPGAYVNNQHGVANVNDFQLDNVHIINSNPENALEKERDEIHIDDSQNSNAKLFNDNISDTQTCQTRVDDSQFLGAYVNNQLGVANVIDFQLDNAHAIASNPEKALESQPSDASPGDSIPSDNVHVNVKHFQLDNVHVIDSNPENTSQPAYANPGDSRPSDGAEEGFDLHVSDNQVDDLEQSHIVHENGTLTSRAYLQGIPQSSITQGETAAP